VHIPQQHGRLVLSLDQAAHGAMSNDGVSTLTLAVGIFRANLTTAFFELDPSGKSLA
jgi:hypothetical protein